MSADSIDPGDVIFVGMGRSVLNWYRCAVPAFHLGCDWVGVSGLPGEDLQMVTGNVASMPELSRYKVVFLQYGRGQQWLDEVRRLQAAGATVIYEIDDDLIGAGQQSDHEAAAEFTEEKVEEHLRVMRACDGLVVSTLRLAEVYYQTNRNVFVCRNGLDLGRYNVTLPHRDSFVVGWAGSIGHSGAVRAWLPAVEDLMSDHDEACFVSLGKDFAADLADAFPSRVLHVPFTSIECFPGALTNMDYGLAPAGDSDFFRGKSDLRFLEYSAVGVPGAYSPSVYGEVCGLARAGSLVSTADELRADLEWAIGNRKLARASGQRASRYVRAERSAEKTCTDWIRAIEETTA